MNCQNEKKSIVEKVTEKYPIRILLFPFTMALIVAVMVSFIMWHDRGASVGLGMIAFFVIMLGVAFLAIRRKWMRLQAKAKQEAQPDFYRGGGI